MIDILLVLYNHSFTYLTCTHLCHGGVVEESRDNIRYLEMMRCHKANGRFWLLRKGYTHEKKHLKNAPATTAIGHRHAGAVNSGGTMKICKKHQTFEVIG